MNNVSHARLGNLDALRGFCAVLVFFQHALPLKWLGAGMFSSMPSFYVDVGRIGVGAFFLVSGYVIPFSIRQNSTLISFWIGRFFRLWPAYIVSIILALVFNVDSALSLSSFSIALNFTMLQQFLGVPNILGVYWTLQIELIFYFIISMMFLVGIINDKKKVHLAFYFFLFVSVAMGLMRFIFELKLPVALPISLSLMFFAADLRLSRIKEDPFSIAGMLSLMAMLIVTCMLSYSTNIGSNDNPYKFILSYFLAICLFIFFERCKDAPNYLVFFGSISYSFYLLHPIVLSFFKMGNMSAYELVIAFVATVMISTISWIFIEKPFQKIGKEINRGVIKNRLAKAG